MLRCLGSVTGTTCLKPDGARRTLSLRPFEGCASGNFGRVEGANIVKLSRAEPKVPYLSCSDFETAPHPALAEALTVNLRTFGLRVRRYTHYRNPPILHRKEAFLAAAHPLRAKFARLEEAKGLDADPAGP